MANVDIFVGNETIIDTDVYQLWLNGYTGGYFFDNYPPGDNVGDNR